MPFERWTSRAARELVHRVLAREVPVHTVPADGDDHWAQDLLLQWLRGLEGRKRQQPSTRRIAAAARQATRELQTFARNMTPTQDALHRLEQPGFAGRREDLVRVLADPYGDELRRWRKRTGRATDLRGANLAGLNLGSLDFTKARLRGADLSGAVARVASFVEADLRDCWLRHTDFSHSDLRRAKLSRAKLMEAMLVDADLRGADLRETELLGTMMNGAKLQGANLSGAIVWGVSTWDIKTDEDTRQHGLIIAPGITADPNEWDPARLRRSSWTVPADDLEVAHFISMLVANPTIGRVVNAAADKIALLLGRFTGRERKVLEVLQDAMPEYGYVPLVFDFAEPDNRDTIETVSVLAGLSSFVIANLSRPRSTPLEAQLIIPTIAVPFVPIVRQGERPFSMFAALERKYPWVLSVVAYTDERDLRHKLRTRVVEPAERKGLELRRKKHPDAVLPAMRRSAAVARLRRR
jgi:hypothetical protein